MMYVMIVGRMSRMIAVHPTQLGLAMCSFGIAFEESLQYVLFNTVFIRSVCIIFNANL